MCALFVRAGMAILQKPLGSAQEPPPEPWDASDVNDDADGGSFISEGLVGAPRSGMLGRAMQSPPLLEAHLSLPATQKEATGTGERGAIAARHFDDDGESGAPGLWTHMDWRLETAMTEGVARATVDSGGGSMVQPAVQRRPESRSDFDGCPPPPWSRVRTPPPSATWTPALIARRVWPATGVWSSTWRLRRNR